MPNWTKEQNDAIYEHGKNIIVSAGAGSGKTAVLSERVLKKIENGVDVDHLLILTFTKAAAMEMKERIRKKIKKNPNLREQLHKLDNSYITTFDSYSLSVVLKYHYLLDIKPDVKIIDSNVLNIKVNEYLDAVMEDMYREKKDYFVRLINDFCIKDDQEIKDAILSLNNKLNMKYDKKEYLDNYLDDYYNSNKIEQNFAKYEKYLLSIIKEINDNFNILSHYVDVDYLHKLEGVLSGLLTSQNYDELRENVLSINRLPNLARGSDDETKKIKQEIADKIKVLKLLAQMEREELIKSILETKDYLKAIIEIINRLDIKIDAYKKENDLYDFVDISKMAIRIVKENNDIKEEIQKYFEEILIDEYQDTSDLQEEFISLISNNNLYMVGDVKQSIYRFRNANPHIFREKYNNYAKNFGGIKIDLLKNFRSREEVLNNINLLFDYIMSDDIGGANYIKEHQMIFGNTSYNMEGKTNQNNNLEIYKYSLPNNTFQKEEIEAFIIANDIIDKVKNHYQVYDKDNQILRDITYNDFSILIDRSQNFELYKKIFLYKQIPLSIYKDEYLTNSSLYMVIKSIFELLTLLNNHGNDKEIEYAFLSIGRSFLFNIDDNVLFDIIKNKTLSQSVIMIKIKKILNNIDSKTITMLLDEIIEEFNVYEKLRTIPSINENLVKIEYLYSLSKTLSDMSYNYEDFVLFLNDLMEKKNDISFSLNRDDGNSVKIMTIHKSKGLEYHICYFPGLTKKFNESDLKERIVYHSDLGIIMPYFNGKITNTFYHELLKKDYIQEEISEKIRLFYVALTRAKEKMIFILPEDEKEREGYEEDGMVSNSIRLLYNSFADILKSLKSKISPFEKNIDFDSIGLTKNYNLINSNNVFEMLKKDNRLIEIMDYPHLKVQELETNKFSKNNMHLLAENEKEMMELGTKMHYYLECLDFRNPSLEGMNDFIREKITMFLNCPLMQSVSKAKIYQEYEFLMQEKDNIKHGIIDLMLEYSDYIDIIDYKLKNIMDDAYVLQLNGYRDYIKKITGKKVNIYLYSIMDGVYHEL